MDHEEEVGLKMASLLFASFLLEVVVEVLRSWSWFALLFCEANHIPFAPYNPDLQQQQQDQTMVVCRSLSSVCVLLLDLSWDPV